MHCAWPAAAARSIVTTVTLAGALGTSLAVPLMSAEAQTPKPGGSAPTQEPKPEPKQEPKQEPKKEEPKKEDPATAAPQPIVDTSSDAIKVLAENEKALADTEPRLRAKAIETFVVRRNELYVKPLAAFLKDKNDDVAKAAARALGNQPFPSCTAALLDFAANEKNLSARSEVAAEAIRALGSAGLGKKGYEKLRPLFENAAKDVQVAICQAFGAAKEKKAFSFFVDQFDEPAPENAASGSNPPASYWKARHDAWVVYRQYVRRGIKELTGESFPTGQQYVEWAAGAGKKARFVYTKDS